MNFKEYLIESLTKYDAAHKIAQQNACVTNRKGGLGLRKNTAKR